MVSNLWVHNMARIRSLTDARYNFHYFRRLRAEIFFPFFRFRFMRQSTIKKCYHMLIMEHRELRNYRMVSGGGVRSIAETSLDLTPN